MPSKNTPVTILPMIAIGLCSMTFGTAHASPGGPPPNDSCGTVTSVPLTIGDTITFTGDNTGADTVGDAEAGTLLDDYGPNVWHIFTTSACADVTISYCGTTPAFGNVWNLLATTCPANDVLIGATSFNDTDCSDGNRTIYYNDLPAGTYYLPVLLDPFASIGPYTIDVSAAPCAPPGPSNDACGDAVAEILSVGASLVFTGDNTGADSTGDAVPGSLLASYGEEVWHLFTTTECADVTIDFCDGATVFANYWNLLATSCPATDVLVYATSFNNADCANGNRTMFFDDLPAGSYYIPVLTDPFSVGPYSIEVSAAPCAAGGPPNDECASVLAEVLAVGNTLLFAGDNTGADTLGDAEAGTLLDQYGPDVWHVFTTSECADVTVSYCGTSPVFGNVWNLLATSCPATDVLVYATSSNTVDCGDGNSTAFYDDLPAGTYYLPVLLDPFNSIGPYGIQVSAVPCVPLPPPNDLCDDTTPELLPLNDALNFTGDNTLATTFNDAEPGTLLATLGLPVVWHAFTTTECLSIIVDYCGTVPPFGNWYNLLATTCPANDVLVFADSSNDVTCLDGNHTIFFNELPAGTYFLPVLLDPFNNAAGPYTVNVLSDSCLTTGTSEIAAPMFSVFPNPGQGEFVIVGHEDLGQVWMELIDAGGRPVIERSITLSKGQPYALDGTGRLAGGSYALRLTSGRGTTTHRVVVN